MTYGGVYGKNYVDFVYDDIHYRLILLSVFSNNIITLTSGGDSVLQ